MKSVHALQIISVEQEWILLNSLYIKLWGKVKDKGSGSLKMPISAIPREKRKQKKDFKWNTGMNKQKQHISMETSLRHEQRKHVSALPDYL